MPVKPSASRGDEVAPILQQQLLHLDRQLTSVFLFGIANATLLVAVLWDVVGHTKLLTWLLTILALNLVPSVLRGLGLSERLLHTHDLTRRTTYYRLAALVVGGAWGSAGLLLFPGDSAMHQTMLTLMLGVTAAGGMPYAAPLRHCYALLAVPMLLPVMLQYLLMGGTVHTTMALMLIIFGLAMLNASQSFYRTMADSISLRLELQRLADEDELTRIPNRRSFDAAFQREWRRDRRQREPISILIADIDHFKAYNDHYGHQAGDGCLQAVAQTLARTVRRPTDTVARWGGEEFVVLLPETPLEGAAYVGERVRAAVEDLALPHEASPVAEHVTVSLGVASTVPDRDGSPEALLQAADAALYRAKAVGRNRVETASADAGTPSRGSWVPHAGRQMDPS